MTKSVRSAQLLALRTPAALALTLAAGSAALAQPTFQLTTIPLLPGTTSSHAQSVNNLGQIVGWCRGPGTTNAFAFMFDPATGILTNIGQINNLGAGGTTAGAQSINDAGEVVGTFIGLPSGRPRAFYWHGGPMIDITSPRPDGVAANGQGWGINASGFIVGLNDLACGGPNASARSAYWNSQADSAHVGDVFGECGSGFPMRAVNASNVIVGKDYINVGGFTWGRPTVTTLPGTQVMLPTWNGTFVGHGNAYGINAAGIVCGQSDANVSSSHACYWTGTTIHVLNGISGGDLADEALGINDAGDIVGKDFTGNAFSAVIWPALSPTAINLQSRLSAATAHFLGTADAISNTGFIAANADIAGPTSRAILLSPCTPAFLTAPAPATKATGDTITFTAAAVGAGPITFVWTRSGVTLTNGLTPAGSTISGATTSTLMISGLTPADAGTYIAVATTPCGTASTAPATLTIAPATCPADFNADGSTNPDDLADYIGAFFSVPPAPGSDFNADGTTDPDDLADYIGAFFASPC